MSTAPPISTLCKHCGGIADQRSTCPKAVKCAACGAKPGQRCKRPSGHAAQQLHQCRIDEAEARDVAADIPWTRSAMPQLSLDQETKRP